MAAPTGATKIAKETMNVKTMKIELRWEGKLMMARGVHMIRMMMNPEP